MDNAQETAGPRQAHDLTPVVDPTLDHGTGPFRTRLPSYVSLLPPCNHACPAGENIQAWLGAGAGGRLPAGVGNAGAPTIRCRRRTAGSAITRAKPPAIAPSWTPPCRSTRSSVSSATWRRPRAGPSPVGARRRGKRVLVVGAGPSGLSAAYHLTRLGHQVEIHEAGPLPGGMLHFGIPAYRLPRADLLAEIARIERMGVRIVLNHKVDRRRSPSMTRRRLRRGVRRDRRARRASTSRSPRATRRACSTRCRCCATSAPAARRSSAAASSIYGGGNTAMDAARTARRLGAEEALIVYRRDRAHMPAHGFEADEAIAEGVKIKWLTTHQGDRRRHADGRADGARRQGPAASDRRIRDAGGGHRRAGARPGQRQRLPARASPASNSNWDTVVVDRQMMTGHPGVFAGGDMVPSERTVTVAVGHGKKAARYIDAWLRGADLRQAGRRRRW